MSAPHHLSSWQVSPYLLTYVHIYLHIYMMEQSCAWKANQFSPSQIPYIVWNPKVHYHIYKSLPPVPVLIQISQVLAPMSCCLILSSHLCLNVLTGFPTKTLYAPLLSPVHATFPTHVILLDFITQKNIWWEVQISRLHYVVLFAPLLPLPSWAQIISSVPYSQIPSAYIPRSMWATEFHTHTKEQETL